MFDEYIGLYGARLYALCLRLCRYGADAQDLYQETWLRAWRARARYDTSRPFDAWLSRICVNAWRDQLRRQKLAQMLHARDAQCPAVNAQEDYSDVREAVDRLAEPPRLTVLLYYATACSVDETAHALGVRTGTVKSRLSRARLALRTVLLRRGNLLPSTASSESKGGGDA